MKRKIDKLIQLDNLKQTYIHRYERVAFNTYKHNYIYIYIYIYIYVLKWQQSLSTHYTPCLSKLKQQKLIVTHVLSMYNSYYTHIYTIKNGLFTTDMSWPLLSLNKQLLSKSTLYASWLSPIWKYSQYIVYMHDWGDKLKCN